MDNERKTLTFDQLPQAVGELLEKVNYLIDRLDKTDAASSNQEDDMLMTINEACQFLGKARSTMYALTSENRIPYRKCGNKLYFFKKDLLEWIKSGGVFDSAERPVEKPAEKGMDAFEAHAIQLRNQKKNKPSTFKYRKEATYE